MRIGRAQIDFTIAVVAFMNDGHKGRFQLASLLPANEFKVGCGAIFFQVTGSGMDLCGFCAMSEWAQIEPVRIFV